MRIIFCADVKYPHGVAGANRVQYVAKAFQERGHDVFVLATGTTFGNNSPNKYMCDDGIEFTSLPMGNNRIVGFIYSKIINGIHAVEWLKKNCVYSDVVIYVYASNNLYVEPILKFANNNGIKSIIDVVEWHQPIQYKYGVLNYRFQSVNRTFEKLTHRFHHVIAISELLKNHFDEKGCKSLLLPMIIDTQAVNSDIKADSKKNVIDLIYQGNPCREDFVTMLKAMVLLEENGEGQFVFHTTGVKEETVRKQLGTNASMLDYLSDKIVFHGWIDYDELQGLFKRMDFLFMSRNDDLIRKANFPSKLPECMARGIIPICNKVGDYWKYLSDKDSILFKESTVDSCVEALRRAMAMSKSELVQMKQNAILCAQSNFDYRRWADILDNYVKSL